jgi:ABC-type glycerol-3-phosphate transport system permease component
VVPSGPGAGKPGHARHGGSVQRSPSRGRPDRRHRLFPGLSIHRKISIVTAAGDLPDVFDLDGPTLAQFVDAGLLAPLDTYIDQKTRADFLPTIIEQGTIDGTLYALGAFDSAMVLYYDRIMLAEAGIIGFGLFVNSMAAFAFARMRFPEYDLLFGAVVVLIILPVEVLVIPLFLTARDLNLNGGYFATMTALILPFTAKAINIFFLRQHFLALPATLEDAARVDGASWWQIYLRVALPTIKPALATVVVLDVLTHWGDFIWPLVVCTREETRTMQISLANLFTQPPVQWGNILACAVMATLPVLLIFRYAQRLIVVSHLDAGIK